jgi:ankyrin repeat protein
MSRSLAWLIACGAAATLSAAAPATDLLTAVKSGNDAAVRAVLRQRVDVNAREADGTTALHWAARAGDVPTVRLLVGAGADPNAVNRYGASALSLAARAGNAGVLEVLLKAGASLRTADAALAEGQTTLMLAARTGTVEAVQMLVAHGEDVNAAEHRTGTTAVMWAALDDRAAAVRALAAAGADVNARSMTTVYPHTPPGVIGDKVEEGASYVGQSVLPKGAWTALMYAARQGAVGAATALAETGADLDAVDPDGTSALIFAIINGHFDLAAVLVDKGANVNVADRTGASPLYSAVDMHTMPTTFGRPDLTPAIVAGSVGAIKMLLAHGADPNARLKDKIVKRQYNPGDPRLGEGATPFMRAARGGDVAVMRLLLQAGADPALVQKNGNTPIHLAASISLAGNNPDHGIENGALAAMDLCLEAGADINAVNAVGDTAVHVALGSPAILRYLAEHGAKLDVKNKQGRTPLEAALRARESNQETIALLRRLTGA